LRSHLCSPVSLEEVPEFPPSENLGLDGPTTERRENFSRQPPPCYNAGHNPKVTIGAACDAISADARFDPVTTHCSQRSMSESCHRR
jgi:hypothetical protein